MENARPPVLLSEAGGIRIGAAPWAGTSPNSRSRARWFDGWKGRSPPRLGKYADAFRRCEVAEARTWLLEKGWRRIGLVDPAEVPGTRRRRQASAAV